MRQGRVLEMSMHDVVTDDVITDDVITSGRYEP